MYVRREKAPTPPKNVYTIAATMFVPSCAIHALIDSTHLCAERVDHVRPLVGPHRWQIGVLAPCARTGWAPFDAQSAVSALARVRARVRRSGCGSIPSSTSTEHENEHGWPNPVSTTQYGHKIEHNEAIPGFYFYRRRRGRGGVHTCTCVKAKSWV